MDVEERPLKVYFIPYLAAGHMIPLCDIARRFASSGQHVTIITTPFHAQMLHKSGGPLLHIHTVDFPFQEVRLPEGIETMSAVTDISDSAKVYRAAMLLQGPIGHFMEQHPPDCIVGDFMLPWVDDLANKLQIPRLSFNSFPLFAVSAIQSLRAHPLHHSGPFVVPDFPHHITIKSTPPKGFTEFVEPRLALELKSHGLIVNNYVELDGEEYVNHYEKTTGHKAWHLGPACLIRTPTKERGQRSVVSENECLSWLNSKQPNVVLYICFGSMCHFPDKQLYEMACGIEKAETYFIWVVPEKKGKEDEKQQWLPDGFEERNNSKGMIIKGWAPQLLILDHPAVGAFLTHCGWNSTLEAVAAGVPMITWPVHGEQFYNEKLITQVRGIGVEVGVEEWCVSGFQKREKLVTRDNIEKAVRRLMDGGDNADQIRQRAQEFAEKARQAVENNGSSHNNLTALINDLKRLRNGKPLD